MNINEDIGKLKGVGPKTALKLNKCGIFTILDLLLYFPRDYENLSLLSDISKVEDGQKVVVKCRPLRLMSQFRSKSGKIVTKILFSDGENNFYGIWFNQPYIKNKFNFNETYTIMGKVKKTKSEITINNPIQTKDEGLSDEKIVPKYALSGTLKNTFFIRLIFELLQSIKIEENMPEWVIKKYAFHSLDMALREIHSPNNLVELRESNKRLKFQELFTYSLKVLILKEYLKKNNRGFPFKIAKELVSLKESLPFKLTEAQNLVIRDILKDEKRPQAMNRLVQGDVGSGKTIVALIAIFNVIKNGFQAVLMAPTEILAKQHLESASALFKNFDIKIGLLTGSVTEKNKKIIKEKLKEGEIDLIIGTHALIEDNVEFKNLGIVVTDELHRFGVMQRNRLFNKGNNIDVLVMTATPIPRTLALYLYGDLDVSIIDTLPPGRKEVKTLSIKKSNKDKAYNFALKEIKSGRQVYVVCPLVEENEKLELTSVEKLYNELKKEYFKDISVEMLHGKMPPKEKNVIMERFKNKETTVLVSTTVIEVGVNVPNASVMIIEDAQRFGLAQLHQLRGRVGRGEYQSYCMLVCDIKSKIAEKRMEIMCSSNDGFYISEEDFKLRGSGEVFGIRQSGDDGLILSDIIQDIGILKEANSAAKKLIKSTVESDIVIKKSIIKSLKSTSKYICFN
ncbi:ATP-dependent DNA helicase RecG [Clostridium felsineum]|uniref:ATP-dependent DNA helicase RecG n=1 Tax=Clostridium felsineum TaxID=36839 RepID=A0A1S8LN07_9CLOT|nr:ATP-dependent DNA helicase RecG [Clostridium felsineum]URZ06561.1 ATP-dependent DNA helicase RecG [Clostridium felsineum]URZ11596.1 ATP-dependent DNA helicase RecG [Clostridium felsineum]